MNMVTRPAHLQAPCLMPTLLYAFVLPIPGQVQPQLLTAFSLGRQSGQPSAHQALLEQDEWHQQLAASGQPAPSHHPHMVVQPCHQQQVTVQLEADAVRQEKRAAGELAPSWLVA